MSGINLERAAIIAKDIFDKEGVVTQLPGYVDANFKLETTKGYTFILKIAGPNEKLVGLEFQNEILKHISSLNLVLNLPKVIPNQEGEFLSTTIENGEKRGVRLLSWVEGRLWAKVRPKTARLRFDLGLKAGQLLEALKKFDHPFAHREFDWDLAQADWIVSYINRFEGHEKKIVEFFLNNYSAIKDEYKELPKSVIHNDINDYNILVSDDLIDPKVMGIIDFGDAIFTQTINDLAILLAYAIMDVPDPLEAAKDVIRGYHKSYSLSANELKCLHTLVAMRLITTITKSSIQLDEDPTNEYHQISAKPAWNALLKWFDVNAEFAYYSFREACGYKAHPQQEVFKEWSKRRKFNFTELFPSEQKEEVHLLDLKVSSEWMGSQSDFNDLNLFEYKIGQLQKKYPEKLIAGGYCEPRPIYTSSEYDKEGNNGPESRTIHLGIDFWLPVDTPVHTMFDGEVYTSVIDEGYKEYGGLIILKHQEDGIIFYSLYGHLSEASTAKYETGDRVKKGDCIGYLGNKKENGEWSPHLHFQLMLSMLDYSMDFPGVAYSNQLEVWKSLCPDPNLLFKNNHLTTQYNPTSQSILNFRKTHLGKSLSVSYNEPLHIVRGDGVYLFDTDGRKYLDTVNNVAHVGHEHPKVVTAGQKQMSLLNTNTRYLHTAINDYAVALLETLPEELCVLHFVNSGSEANELAIRMAKATTGNTDILAIEMGYHGNTNAVVDVSSYKFDGKGGQGKPETTHILPLPDPFRGIHREENSGEKYAAYVQKILEELKSSGKGVAAFIGEPIISCGGQIVPPKNYFKSVYKYVREAGGLCIADEVQTGFGRVGSNFWAFQMHDVIPDIVTMGKPAGNGHPLAAVACTQEVANKFANGMEYFNTFGGNPVSASIGKAVLDVIKEEKLQRNASEVGEFLKAQLQQLQKEFPIIGDVRGEGLFLGFELVDKNKNPLAKQATYLANQMKTLGILMSTDGPDNNVLKIKPPIVFSLENGKELIFRLKTVFNHDFMKNYNL